MKNLTFKIVTCLFLFFNLQETKASHIVGGQIEYRWLQDTTYEVTVKFYRDCAGVALPNSVTICLYDQSNNTAGQIFVIPLDTSYYLSTGNSCVSAPGLCTDLGIYKDTAAIASNPNGWYMIYSTSARTAALYNVVPGAITWYSEMPDPALHNSSPHILSNPKSYFCHSYPNFESLSATDIDGDSLVYYMDVPLAGTGSCSPKPTGGYTPVTYRNSCTSAMPFGLGTPAPTIDKNTGVMGVNPATGTNGNLYVLATRIEEYRNGVKLGEVRREYQYKVLTCSANLSATINYNSATNTLNSLDTLVSYQWVTCPAMTPISGATNKQYVPPTPGSYAVIVSSTSPACTDTSSCITISTVGVSDLRRTQSANEFDLFPNPAHDKITLRFEKEQNGEVRLYNTFGQLVFKSDIQNKKSYNINTSVFPKGVYLLNLKSDIGITNSRKLILY